MPNARPAAVVAVATALALGGCGKSAATGAGEGPARRLAPVLAPGAVSVATRNTTRLGGANAIADAAAVARTVYPGLSPQSRPSVVALVDAHDWSAALAASVLASSPLGAPILYAEGASGLPRLTRESLAAMHPTGAASLGGAQVLALGYEQPLAGFSARRVRVGEPAVSAAEVEAVLAAAAGAPRQVIVVAADAARALQMPAAGLAAESGAPILFVTHTRVPAATAAVLRQLRRPTIYLLGAAQIGSRTRRELRAYGAVTVISTGAGEEATPAGNAIAVARFTDGAFGWGVKEPGHGLVFANAARPLDGPAAAPLSASGDYAPLLLLESPGQLPAPLSSYLGDIQPAYTSAPQFRPVRGVYNHGWLIGDEAAIGAVTQAQIDDLLEISPRHQSSEEAAVSQSE